MSQQVPWSVDVAAVYVVESEVDFKTVIPRSKVVYWYWYYVTDPEIVKLKVLEHQTFPAPIHFMQPDPGMAIATPSKDPVVHVLLAKYPFWVTAAAHDQPVYAFQLYPAVLL